MTAGPGLSVGDERPDRWQVTPGRRLRWGPVWSETDGALVFDAASGDYWVLSQEARRLLLDIDGAKPDCAPVQDVAAPVGLMAELERCGLIAKAA